MKRILAVVLAAFALIAGLAVPANAQTLPPDVSGTKFWSDSICVDGSAVNGTYYRVAYIAQQWNIQGASNAGGPALTYKDDCAAAGFPPSRRFVIGSINNPSAPNCYTVTNTHQVLYNGMYRWTDGPGFYLNFGHPSCISSQTRRDHLVSMAIGQALGLAVLNSDGYNSRVMNQTAWSWDNVPLPTGRDGGLAYQIYTGAFCDPPFSGC